MLGCSEEEAKAMGRARGRRTVYACGPATIPARGPPEPVLGSDLYVIRNCLLRSGIEYLLRRHESRLVLDGGLLNMRLCNWNSCDLL
jgi:hypothetical protein